MVLNELGDSISTALRRMVRLSARARVDAPRQRQRTRAAPDGLLAHSQGYVL